MPELMLFVPRTHDRPSYLAQAAATAEELLRARSEDASTD
jgi:hypothetical protein